MPDALQPDAPQIQDRLRAEAAKCERAADIFGPCPAYDDFKAKAAMLIEASERIEALEHHFGSPIAIPGGGDVSA